MERRAEGGGSRQNQSNQTGCQVTIVIPVWCGPTLCFQNLGQRNVQQGAFGNGSLRGQKREKGGGHNTEARFVADGRKGHGETGRLPTRGNLFLLNAGGGKRSKKKRRGEGGNGGKTRVSTGTKKMESEKKSPRGGWGGGPINRTGRGVLLFRWGPPQTEKKKKKE